MSNNTLTRLISNMINNSLFNIHTALPGIVQSYDETKHKAEIKPMTKRLMASGEVLEYPIIANVPVIFPRTQNFIMHFPIKKNDGVLVVFSERSLDNYLSTGKNELINDGKRFDLSDAIAIPGFFSFDKESKVENNEDFIINYNDAKIKIDKQGKIAFGKGSDELVDLIEQILDALNATTVNTSIGPQPLSKALDQTFTTIKTKLGNIKGSL